MSTPNQEEYFTEWIKPFPRDVTKFGAKSSDLKTITYNIPFYLYGIKFHITASSYEIWLANGNASDFGQDIANTFFFNIEITFEDGRTYNKPFNFTTRGKDAPSKSFVKTGGKIKKIKVSGGVLEESVRQEYGGTNLKQGHHYENGKLHYYTYEVKWYYTVKRYTKAYISDLKIYEHPYIDSGMRIADKSGKVVIPAETAFPSPLRIFHKKIRNIMLVPLGCDFASVFKIKTEEGIQAISTIS